MIHGTERSVERRQREMQQDRGALLKKEGDIVKEYKAMHEEKILRSWPREDVEGIAERRKDREREKMLERRKAEVVKRGGEDSPEELAAQCPEGKFRKWSVGPRSTKRSQKRCYIT